MRVGIVGCGRMGRRHAKYYHELPDVQMTGCYDSNPAVARAFADEFGVRAYSTLDDLVQGSVNGISVCTPPSAHVDAIFAGVEHGVRVLCEKPLARRAQDCARIPPDAPLACAFKFRHLPGAAPLRDLIRRGALGRIISLRGTAVSNIDMSQSWFSDPAVAGGGVLLDNGVHLIDLCRFLVGPVTAAVASLAGNTRQLAVEESASVLLQLAGGATAHLLLSWEAPAPMPPLIEVQGSAGYARLGYELEVFDSTGRERLLHIPADGVDIWRAVIANFVGYVRGQGQPSATFEDGHAAVAVVEAAYRSLDTEAWERPASFRDAYRWSPDERRAQESVAALEPVSTV